MVPGYDQRQARTGLAGLTKPDPKEQAAQIVAWAICWPWNVVWTFCVYNPFRYIGEFLLREIQSALFEISNGQFSSIERDLTLDPLPPPYPIPAKQARRNHGAAPVVPIEVANVATPETTVEPQLSADITAEPSPVPTPGSDSPATIQAITPTGTAELNEATEQATQPVAVETSLEESIEDLPAEVEAELAEGGSSDSYTWAPPASTAFVPMSDQPLRAVKYETGSAVPATPVEQTSPAKPETDPWFETQVQNR